MAPVLRMLESGKPRRTKELVADVIDYLQLTDEARAEVLPAGDSRAESRAGWALSFLTRAGALARPGRGEYVITTVGRDLLARHPSSLREENLRELPAWRGSGHRGPYRQLTTHQVPVHADEPAPSAEPALDPPASTPVQVGADPHESIQAGLAAMNGAVAGELLHRLRSESSDALRRVVIDLLVAMGYGGPRGSAAKLAHVDAGQVAGIVEHDPLGLENIYVRALRRHADACVGAPALQEFVGVLHGSVAERGIFITTSWFTPEAVAYAQSIASRVVLIDGAQLAELLIRYRVGVREKHTYTVVEIDEGYFE